MQLPPLTEFLVEIFKVLYKILKQMLEFKCNTITQLLELA